MCVISAQGSNPICLKFLKDEFKVYQGIPPTYWSTLLKFCFDVVSSFTFPPRFIPFCRCLHPQVLPIRHVSETDGEVRLVNPQAVDLKSYEEKLNEALEKYNTWVGSGSTKIIWTKLHWRLDSYVENYAAIECMLHLLSLPLHCTRRNRGNTLVRKMGEKSGKNHNFVQSISKSSISRC